MDHSTKLRSRRDSGSLNEIRVDTIPDHSTESRSTMHIEPFNEIQAGYDSRPLNEIADHEGFRTTQRNLDGAKNRTTQRNPSGNPVSDPSTEPSGKAKNMINGSKKQNMNQVLNLQRLNEMKQSTSTKFRTDQRSKK